MQRERDGSGRVVNIDESIKTAKFEVQWDTRPDGPNDNTAE